MTSVQGGLDICKIIWSLTSNTYVDYFLTLGVPLSYATITSILEVVVSNEGTLYTYIWTKEKIYIKFHQL